MFPTLMSKTFFILFLSLVVCYTGAQLVISYFRRIYERDEAERHRGTDSETSWIVFAERDQITGEVDLHIDEGFLTRLFWFAFITNIFCFAGLMWTQNLFPLNMFMMGLFTFSDGVTLGIVLLSIDENLAIKVTWLTALTTLLTAMIGLHSQIDFSFLPGILFWSLLILLVISTIRLFISIRGLARRVIASAGILIFVGFLLFDFNRIKKLKDLTVFNNWNTALDCSIDLYLDIINLFLQFLDLLSNHAS